MKSFVSPPDCFLTRNMSMCVSTMLLSRILLTQNIGHIFLFYSQCVLYILCTYVSTLKCINGFHLKKCTRLVCTLQYIHFDKFLIPLVVT